jgi:DNA-binding NarL/FixJ family response regulator
LIWQMCESLRACGVRFVVLSAPQPASIGGRALSCGAATVLQKPVAKTALLQLVHSLAS